MLYSVVKDWHVKEGISWRNEEMHNFMDPLFCPLSEKKNAE